MFTYTQLPLNLLGNVYNGSTPAFAQIHKHYEASLKSQKIDTIVFLCPTAEAETGPAKMDLAKWYKDNGFNVIHFPIVNRRAPELEALTLTVNQVYKKALEGENVLIHCKGGAGRTGTFSACLVKKAQPEEIKTGKDATAWVTKYNEVGMPESTEQEQFISKFCEAEDALREQEKALAAQTIPPTESDLSIVDLASSLLYSKGYEEDNGSNPSNSPTDSPTDSPMRTPEVERKILPTTQTVSQGNDVQASPSITLIKINNKHAAQNIWRQIAISLCQFSSRILFNKDQVR